MSQADIISKYGKTFIVYANLWEIERKLTAAELTIAKQIREDETKKIKTR